MSEIPFDALEIVKFEWEMRKKDLPMPPEGNLYVSKEDLICYPDTNFMMQPGSVKVFRFEPPQSHDAQELLNFQTAKLAPRSGLGQAGLHCKTIAINKGGVYVGVQNHSDYNWQFSAGMEFKGGKLIAEGNPLEEDDFTSALPLVQSAQKQVIVGPDGKMNRIAVPLTNYYRRNDERITLPMHALPSGTQRTLMHSTLGIEKTHMDTSIGIRRPVEIVSTDPVVLSGGIALVVEDTIEEDEIYQHGPARYVYAEETDHRIMGEYLSAQGIGRLPREMHFTLRRQYNAA